VHKYLIDGNCVLEDCGYIAGKCIPIVPYYAKRQIVDGVERVSGRVRLAIDAQRLYNMLVSMLADIAADSPKEKPIFTPEEIAGHETMWSRDNVDRYPYLLKNRVLDSNGNPIIGEPLQYTKAPSLPPALAGSHPVGRHGPAGAFGLQNDQQDVVSNISAKAVELIQNRMDMADFIFMDNLKLSMKRAGEIWLSMARELYDEDDRPMRLVNLDGSDEVQKLNQKTVGDDESHSTINDPGKGKFKVTADVGPSFTTRRDGTVRSITGMLQYLEDPADKAALTGVAIQNLEGEGMEDIKAYFRKKSIAMGITKPNEEEQKELDAEKQNQQPAAQDQFLLASAQKAAAQAQEALANTKLLEKKVAESEAAAAANFAKVQALPIDQILRLIDSLNAGDAAQQAQAVQQQAQPAPAQ
jgi:hypothetical protein